MLKILLALTFAAAIPGAASDARAADKIAVVAAENFYGDLAAQIGGNHIAVTTILSNPDQDPHLFESSVSTAKAVAHAQIVIYNGVDYDGWMEKLCRPQPIRTERRSWLQT